MKLTNSGCRISKNGSIITSIEKEAIKSSTHKGLFFKKDGTYYYFNRKQGNIYVYLS